MEKHHIPLPGGDTLVADSEIAEELDVTQRTLTSYDKQGCPFVMIGGKKWRPHDEVMTWIASRIKRRNPPRSRVASGNDRSAA